MNKIKKLLKATASPRNEPVMSIFDDMYMYVVDIDPMMKLRQRSEQTHAVMNQILRKQHFGSKREADEFVQELTEAMEKSTKPPRLFCESPLDEAQQLIYDAWEAPEHKKAAMAYEALKISQDCLDAYLLLAEYAANSLEQSRDFYQKAIQTGQRLFGAEMFTYNRGIFWQILETRPYMRAMAGLADCLWRLKDRRQAIAHYKEMLVLNPGDNQAIRYVLLNSLLEEGGYDSDVKELLKRYKNDTSAHFSYGRALFAYHRQQRSREANAYLRSALNSNKFVPVFSLDMRPLPKTRTYRFTPGSPEEAVDYAISSISAWQAIPGARKWLEEIVGTIPQNVINLASRYDGRTRPVDLILEQSLLMPLSIV